MMRGNIYRTDFSFGDKDFDFIKSRHVVSITSPAMFLRQLSFSSILEKLQQSSVRDAGDDDDHHHHQMLALPREPTEGHTETPGGLKYYDSFPMLMIVFQFGFSLYIMSRWGIFIPHRDIMCRENPNWKKQHGKTIIIL